MATAPSAVEARPGRTDPLPTRLSAKVSARLADLRRPDVAIIAVLCVAFAVARILGAWGRSPVGFPDSDGYRPPTGGLPYDVVSFLGHAPRSWFLPLVYSSMPSDQSILVLQVVVSIVAWSALAIALASVLRHPAVRVGAGLLVLALATTPQVATWDLALLAESLSISLTVGSLAAWLRFAHNRRWLPGAVAVLITSMWLFSRPYQYVYTLGLAGLLAAWALSRWWVARRRPAPGDSAVDVGSRAGDATGDDERRRRRDRRSWIVPTVMAAVLVVCSAWSVVITRNTNDGYRLRDGRDVPYWSEAFGQNMFKRYLNDPAATAFFQEQGLPPLDGLQPSVHGHFVNDYGDWHVFYAEIRNRPEWMAWLEGPSRSAFTEYVVSHPSDVVTDFLDDAPQMLRSPFLTGYGEAAEVPGSWLGRQLYFRGSDTNLVVGDTQALLLLAVALAVAAVATRRRLELPVVVVGVVTVGVGASLFGLSWLGSAYELVRHGIPAVQLLRVGALILVAAGADALASGPRPRADVDAEDDALNAAV